MSFPKSGIEHQVKLALQQPVHVRVVPVQGHHDVGVMELSAHGIGFCLERGVRLGVQLAEDLAAVHGDAGALPDPERVVEVTSHIIALRVKRLLPQKSPVEGLGVRQGSAALEGCPDPAQGAAEVVAGDLELPATDDQAALPHVRAAQMVRPVQGPGLEALVPGVREVGCPRVGIDRQRPLARLDQADKTLARRGPVEVVVERLELRQIVPLSHGPGPPDLPLTQAVPKGQLLLVRGVQDAIGEAVVPGILAFDEQQQGLHRGSCGVAQG